MYLTGFADEAADAIDGQIKATQALGWRWIESRGIEKKNIHDLDDAAFDRIAGRLADSGVGINCFGSAICNWGKKITDPDDASLAEVRRAIPRMRRLGAKLVRIMSYAVIPGKPPAEQQVEERARRLRGHVQAFLDAGIQPVHENCMNYGGMGWQATLDLIERVPGLKLVFDCGNPVFTDDWTQAPFPDGSRPKQSPWAFYRRVREHVAYLHVKDGVFTGTEMRHTMPGRGDGDVRRIVKDLLARGYDGGFSIEPHLAVVHHDPRLTSPEAIRYANYVEYGFRFESLLAEVRAELVAEQAAAQAAPAAAAAAKA